MWKALISQKTTFIYCPLLYYIGGYRKTKKVVYNKYYRQLFSTILY